MDYVYICRDGDNEELKYSIRSVIKNATHDSIWVIGGKPDWYSGNFVKVDDIGNKFENINNCYKVISQISGISNKFVLMNDDFFILGPIGEPPIFYGGSLMGKIERYIAMGGSTKYTRVLMEAYKRLIRLGISDPRDYDIHTPMVIDRTKIESFIDLSYAPRSMYGNLNNVGGKEINDVKIYNPKRDLYEEFDINIMKYFLSTEDESFDAALPFLNQAFPEPSKYERP